jgi:hypothetical protein
MKIDENSVANRVKEQHEVSYTVTAIYCGQDRDVPDALYLQAYDDTTRRTFLDDVLWNEYHGRKRHADNSATARKITCHT